MGNELTWTMLVTKLRKIRAATTLCHRASKIDTQRLKQVIYSRIIRVIYCSHALVCIICPFHVEEMLKLSPGVTACQLIPRLGGVTTTATTATTATIGWEVSIAFRKINICGAEQHGLRASLHPKALLPE